MLTHIHSRTFGQYVIEYSIHHVYMHTVHQTWKTENSCITSSLSLSLSLHTVTLLDSMSAPGDLGWEAYPSEGVSRFQFPYSLDAPQWLMFWVCIVWYFMILSILPRQHTVSAFGLLILCQGKRRTFWEKKHSQWVSLILFCTNTSSEKSLASEKSFIVRSVYVLA